MEVASSGFASVWHLRTPCNVDELSSQELFHDVRIDLDGFRVDSDDQPPWFYVIKQLLQEFEFLIEERTTNKGQRRPLRNKRTNAIPKVYVPTGCK
jgi:hypothetical protein